VTNEEVRTAEKRPDSSGTCGCGRSRKAGSSQQLLSWDLGHWERRKVAYGSSSEKNREAASSNK
jgi:hypothetical protein